MQQFYQEAPRQIPIAYSVDVLVVGSGRRALPQPSTPRARARKRSLWKRWGMWAELPHPV